jgi:hypothetical protein
MLLLLQMLEVVWRVLWQQRLRCGAVCRCWWG